MSEAARRDVERGDDAIKNENVDPDSQARNQEAQQRDSIKQQNKTQEETGMEAHWVALAKELRDADEDLVKNVDDSINSLLLFAGLFSAVQSAFAVATYPLLQSPPHTQKASVMTINIFVFSSLALALICAFVGILRKNQLKQHLSWTSERTDARSQTVLRQFSFELNSSRMLWDSASHISVGLTLAIGLFAVGVFVLLWTLDQCVAEVVFLFACLTLCVIFSRDLPIYYRRCRSWVRAIQRRLYLASSWSWLDTLLQINESQVYAGLRPLVEDHFCLLSRAIMSRTSGLTASGVDPSVGRLAQSIVGLGRLPHGTDVWRVLSSQKTAEAPLDAGLGRVLDIVLAIIKDRDPLKGSHTIPFSLWSRVKGRLTWAKPDPHQRQLPSYRRIPNLIVLGHPWLIWTETAFRQFNTEEQCLLGDIVSDQLAYTLRVTEPLRGSGFGAGLMPEEPLYSAFCLARILLARIPYGPSDMKLRRAIALAGVRLQISNLPSGLHFVSTSSLDHSGRTRRRQAANFVKWSNQSLQQATNEMMGSSDLRNLFNDDLHRLTYNSEEFALDTFLQAALSIDVTSGLSGLSPMLWIKSSHGILFLTASAHALRILKESPASVDTRRPEIRRLCLRLTELLRHDLLTCLLRTGTPFNVLHLATCRFPWHGCLERFVGYFTADSEMGALRRYLVREASEKWALSNFQLDILGALFPPNSEADRNLQLIISQHLAKQSDLAHQPSLAGTTAPEVAFPRAESETQDFSDITVDIGQDIGRALLVTAESSSSQLRRLELSAALEPDQRAAMHASDPGKPPLATYVSSPDGTVPAGEAGFTSPNTSRVLDASALASHAGREATRVDQRSPHRAVDMLPAGQFGLDVTSPGEVVYNGHERTSFKQDVRTLSHSQVCPLASDGIVVGDDQSKRVDRAHSFEEGTPSV